MIKNKIAGIAIVAGMTAMMLSACGGNPAMPTGPSGSGSVVIGGSGMETPARPGSSGETYEVGKFSVWVPEGWSAIKQSDLFADKGEDGTYPADPSVIMVAKGTEDELEALMGPNVRITRYDKGVTVMDNRTFYDNVVELENVTINDTECSAFEGESLEYVYQIIRYETEDAIYEINVLKSVADKPTGIAWDDPDVIAITESLS